MSCKKRQREGGAAVLAEEDESYAVVATHHFEEQEEGRDDYRHCNASAGKLFHATLLEFFSHPTTWLLLLALLSMEILQAVLFAYQISMLCLIAGEIIFGFLLFIGEEAAATSRTGSKYDDVVA
jgi:hypothetical protein